jgi:predicted N-formylglutamate amidohydrolase
MVQASEALTLLSPRDPRPVELVNADARSAFVLACEHAGRAVPERLGDLGVSPADMDRHIAYDRGAEEVSRNLSKRLDAPLVLQRYSRLVIDCNRPSTAPDCFPEISDGTPIPANAGLAAADRQRRLDEIHRPFHQALAALLDRRAAAGATPILVAVHSFTPRLAGGADRHWQLGVLSNRDRRFAERFLAAFQARNPDIPSAHNEPYVVDDLSDYTIPVHGEARGLPHVLIEIRNDLIADAAGQARWAGLIADALTAAEEKDR